MQNKPEVAALPSDIRVIMGLGNPGKKFEKTRHNIGFLVVDALAEAYHGSWRNKEEMEIAEIVIAGKPIVLIKPTTFMNNSGRVIPFLQKKGITPSQLLVVHDELEFPFAKMGWKMGGSHRGHNGLRSIIDAWGADFARLRIGIGRPDDKVQVPDYVLSVFSQSSDQIKIVIAQAVAAIEKQLTIV
jgi:peptidyl-tRNA hydrolase